jgi:hypothetical protein
MIFSEVFSPRPVGVTVFFAYISLNSADTVGTFQMLATLLRVFCLTYRLIYVMIVKTVITKKDGRRKDKERAKYELNY